MNALTLAYSFMFPGAEGEPLQFVVMSNVPTTGWLVCFSLWTHGYPRSGVAGEDLYGGA
jgi:hypothetical protein